MLSFQQKPPLKIASNGNFWRFSRFAIVCLFPLVLAFQLSPRVFGPGTFSKFVSQVVSSEEIYAGIQHIDQTTHVWIKRPLIEFSLQVHNPSKALNLTPEECKVSLLQGFGPKENGRGVWMICSNFWVTLGRYLGEIIMVSFGIWPIPGNKALSTRRCFKLKWSTQSAESLTMLQWLAVNHLLSSYASCTDAWNTSYRWWFQSCFFKTLLAEMFQFDWSFEMAWSLQPDGASNCLFTVMILGIYITTIDIRSPRLTRLCVAFDYFKLWFTNMKFEEYLFVFVRTYEFIFLVQISCRVPWKIPTARGHRVQHAARCVSWRMFS